MITLKTLARKLEKLESSMLKDARRLSKLIRRVKRAAASETMPRSNKRAMLRKTGHAVDPVSPGKKKRKLSPEVRAKLSALMQERWAAKRATIVPVAIVQEEVPVTHARAEANV